MNHSISKDLSRFQIRHLIWISLSVCLAAAVYRVRPEFGLQLLALVTSFWTGFGLMFCADSLDARPIDERGFISKALSTAGALTTVLSVVGIVSWSLKFCIAVTN